MRAITLESGSLKYNEGYQRPVPKPRESLIKVNMSTICDLDKLLFNGYSNFSGILGHEFVGIVQESKNSPHLIGKRVVADIRLNCGECRFCKERKPELCLNRRELGFLDKDGCFAEYMTVPDKNLYVLPDNVPDDQAIFTEALAVCLNLVKKCRLKRGDKVAVVGDLRGLYFTSMILHTMGVEAVIYGKDKERLEFLKQFVTVSVTIDGSFDNVIEQSGQNHGLATALKLVDNGGRVVINSIYVGQQPLPNLSAVTVKELNLIGCRTGLYKEAVDFMAKGLFVRPDIKTFELHECHEAFASDCMCPVFVV